MIFLKNNLIVKIPSYINLYYYSSMLIVFRYKNKLTYLKFYCKFFFTTFNSNFCIILIKNNQYAGNFISYVKKTLYNITKKIYKKLVLIGIGYKILQVKALNNSSILIVKLGFSHCFYFKFSCNNYFSIIKQSKMYLKNCSLKKTLIISNVIRQLKSLTIYNNKGIFFYNQI